MLRLPSAAPRRSLHEKRSFPAVWKNARGGAEDTVWRRGMRPRRRVRPTVDSAAAVAPRNGLYSTSTATTTSTSTSSSFTAHIKRASRLSTVFQVCRPFLTRNLYPSPTGATTVRETRARTHTQSVGQNPRFNIIILRTKKIYFSIFIF